MSEISIKQAALSGFHVIRERPVTVLVWWLLSVVMAMGALAVFASVAGPAVADLQAIQEAGAQADPTAALGLTGKVLSGTFLMLPIYLILGTVLACAANRAVLRPDDSAFGYVRFGGDEFRTMVVFIVIGLIVGVLYLVGAVVGSLVGTINSGVLQGQQPDPQRMLPFFFLGFSPFLLVMIFLALKFSLSTAQTLDTRAIAIFGSWGLTKGRLVKVFLTYLLAGLIYAVIYAVGFAIVYAVWTALGKADAMREIFSPRLTGVADLFTPAQLVYFVVMGLVGAIGLAFTVCPGAALYQQIARPEEEAFE